MQNKKTSSAKVIYGIIGCGNAGREHALAITKNPASALEAVFDTNRSRARNFAKKYGCEQKPDISSLLNDKSINAIVICTPHDTHKNLILKVLAAGKYCVCEKPLCLNTNECRAVVDADHSNKVIVGFQVRFHKPIDFLLHSVRSGTLGKIQFCSVVVRKNRDRHYFSDWHGDKKRTGGMLANHGIHGLDLMLEVCGTPKGMQSIAKHVRGFSPIEDLFVSNIKFSNGATGNVEILTCSGSKKPENSILVIGDKGSIKIGGEVFDRVEYADFINRKGAVFSQKKDGAGHLKLIAAINNYIRFNKKHPFLPSADDGLRATNFVEQLYKNIQK